MAGHHAPDYIQSETGTLADLLSGKERVEDVILDLGWYAGAVVDDLHGHPISVA